MRTGSLGRFKERAATAILTGNAPKALTLGVLTRALDWLTLSDPLSLWGCIHPTPDGLGI